MTLVERLDRALATIQDAIQRVRDTLGTTPELDRQWQMVADERALLRSDVDWRCWLLHGGVDLGQARDTLVATTISPATCRPTDVQRALIDGHAGFHVVRAPSEQRLSSVLCFQCGAHEAVLGYCRPGFGCNAIVPPRAHVGIDI